MEEYARLIDGLCSYCFKDLKQEKGGSLDRIDNCRGYTLDNVLPCCGPCNRVRNKYLTVDEMKAAMKAVLAIRGRVE